MQLQIKFPLFSKETVIQIREKYKRDTITTLQEQVEHLKNSIRTHKGHYTKIKNKK